MKTFLRAQLERHAQRLAELDFLLSREDIMKDMTIFGCRASTPMSPPGRPLRTLPTTRSRFGSGAARMLQDGGDDADMRAMAEEEIASAQTELLQLEVELQRMLLPKDPDDTPFVEIRAGTGGDESALFAADLLRMYMRYAEATRVAQLG